MLFRYYNITVLTRTWEGQQVVSNILLQKLAWFHLTITLSEQLQFLLMLQALRLHVSVVLQFWLLCILKYHIQISDQHLASQSYAICFRRGAGRCALCFSPDVLTPATPSNFGTIGQSFGLRYLVYFAVLNI